MGIDYFGKKILNPKIKLENELAEALKFTPLVF
jgi:hypothetical protein